MVLRTKGIARKLTKGVRTPSSKTQKERDISEQKQKTTSRIWVTLLNLRPRLGNLTRQKNLVEERTKSRPPDLMATKRPPFISHVAILGNKMPSPDEGNTKPPRALEGHWGAAPM